MDKPRLCSSESVPPKSSEFLSKLADIRAGMVNVSRAFAAAWEPPRADTSLAFLHGTL